jgi:MotA/TolQ/ExbB proton channel family
MATRRRQPIYEKPYRTILLWILWAAAAIGVYLTLYLNTDLLAQLKQDQSKITWIIIGLFILGLIISLGLAFTITTEALHATQLGNIAQGQGLNGINISHGFHAVEKFFLSLKDILANNAQPDIEALLNVELSSYHRTSDFVEVLGNLLITLGLIGTVIGLTFTLTGLTTSLGALGHDQELLVEGLRKAMSGMGTAFYTTLLGSVLGGVLLPIFALITDHGIENLADILKKICMVYCSFDIKPSLERDMRVINAEITSLGDNVRHLQQAMEDSKKVMASFREEAKRLNDLSLHENDDEKPTLREAVVLQQYYAKLLQEEIKMMNKFNRAWWPRLKRAMQSRKRR